MRLLITRDAIRPIEIIVNHTVFGVTVHIRGGHTDTGPCGWAYVLAERMFARGMKSNVEAGDGTPAWAIVTVNGSGLYQHVCECVGELR